MTREIPWGSMGHVISNDPDPYDVLAETEEIERRERRPVWMELRPTVRVGFTATWGADVVGYDPGDGVPCPGCNDIPVRHNEVCIVCHQTRDDAWQVPMMPRDERAAILAGPKPETAPPLRTRRQRRASKRKAVA